DPNFGGAGGGFSGFGGGMDFDLGDLFSNIFGGGGFGFGGGRSNPNAPQRGSDIQSTIAISFEEAAKGCKRSVEASRIEVCGECSGSGAAKGTFSQTCPDCSGRGQVSTQQRTPFGTISTTKPCPKCSGKGSVIQNPCQKCRGGGRVRRTSNIEVSIPAGIDDRQIITLRGEGNKGINGGPAGDFRVGINVRPHPFFERDGYNIWCDITVNIVQAALGDELEVPTLDGRVKYSLPAGTQPADVLKLKDKGIPNLNGRGRGDQLLRIVVDVPRKLTEKQKELLRQFNADMGNKAVEEDKKTIFGKKKR
ncbi:MAG: molecular chaperone DnaJ, partial [Oscillospiraceae bacterium]|nr:molecular chaperone DnaJ [Oscillospiraceae bacterium]